ncbi:hypothetical protein B0A50_08382 [Salinomyces thailandicus]|uniref:AhpC/TSA antioxidant enzyme-domain-containing protein n=1 Tax=Salinomyces thailandicus TaxID=706561 RepID=A0A4U0TLB4_9PEZI|nr:hypothetical protein B0A50_08382 [Salinomyces thailandica]
MRPRSVSPVGASRFERPFVTPTRRRSPGSTDSSRTARERPTTQTTNTTTTTTAHGPSPTTPTSPSTPHYSSRRSAASTMASATTTLSTAPSSLLHDPGCDSPACALPVTPTTATSDSADSTDRWFARFRSDPSLAGAVPTDPCPDRATLAAVQDLPLLQADGTATPFGALFHPHSALHPRQLLIFIRHFYCGACQAYLAAISASITKEDYFRIPVPTSIFVIGCGAPDLIPVYKTITGCPFPIFADPSRQLFKKLGMTLSLNIGSRRPEYMKEISAPAWAAGQVTTIRERLKSEEIRKRDVIRGGNPMQIGGEFLLEAGEVIWCHRMKSMRGHAEVGVLRGILELDG